MKTRRRIILPLILIILVLVSFVPVSCGNEGQKDSSTTTSDATIEVAKSYGFWKKDNELRLVNDMKITLPQEEEEEITPPVISHYVEIPREVQEELQKMKRGLVIFIWLEYQVNVIDKMEQQQVLLYVPQEDSPVDGFISEDNVIKINQNILGDDVVSLNFKETYVRESLHMLGFESNRAKALTEGILNALTNSVMSAVEKVGAAQGQTSKVTKIAQQLIATDPEIVSLYLTEGENFDVLERIDKKLSRVDRSLLQEKQPGERLESLLWGLQEFERGTSVAIANGEIASILFEIQEISKAYCQECQPSNEVIDFIRSKYIVDDFESLKVVRNREGEFELKG